MRKSLRAKIIKQWKNKNCPQWSVNETVKIAIESDKTFNTAPAPRFRQAIQKNDKQYLRLWVQGCRFSWLKTPNNIVPKGFIAERMVRSILEKNLKKKFHTGRINRTLVIGQRSTGESIKHEFDLVSKDKNIIGEVKSDKYTKKAHANTRFFRILGACKYLEMIKAKKKMLILTEKEMYKVMKHDLDGVINSNIEIIHINLGS